MKGVNCASRQAWPCLATTANSFKLLGQRHNLTRALPEQRGTSLPSWKHLQCADVSNAISSLTAPQGRLPKQQRLKHALPLQRGVSMLPACELLLFKSLQCWPRFVHMQKQCVRG